MKIEKVRELGEGELRDKVSDLAEEIFRTRLQKETGQLDKMGKVRELRRDLAVATSEGGRGSGARTGV